MIDCSHSLGQGKWGLVGIRETGSGMEKLLRSGGLQCNHIGFLGAIYFRFQCFVDLTPSPLDAVIIIIISCAFRSAVSDIAQLTRFRHFALFCAKPGI